MLVSYQKMTILCFRINQKDGGQIDLHWDWNNVTRQARLRLKGGKSNITN